MVTKVSGTPVLTIAGSTYSASVPVTNYDNYGWAADSTTLVVNGDLTDTGANFLTKLRIESSNWNSALAVRDTFQAKLSNIVGRVL